MDGDETAEASENEQIKSTAIVKYSLPKQAQFMKLQCNTDLNLPPSNWLSSSVDSYGLQPVVSHPKGFSSFRMAQMFPDCVGDVDVISDAENIKKLLKIPYHKGHISMMVHRIDNTLLIDDFDIYKHLIRTAETEWRWLKDFFFENVNRATCDEDKNLYIKSRTREALKEKNLVSKFLYHSLVPSDIKETTNLLESKRRTPSPDPLLPEPSPSTECPDSPPTDHPHNRDVLWTFEDIDMLLGTDLPIFGGGTHPCISLRLCDASKPISVLTGIDYWLDNLMSNVPEVVMCYHLNGIVQKYELIKTEDLPRMDDSKFSPKLIRDVAQSIHSFLKSKATKAGHTYWLFKGKDEEVIKLYDLTSLCSADDVENGTNPFTIPVAMLLYRVARNMKHSTDRKQPGTVRMLLKHCIKLLPYEKYPEIVTSSMYMLSDLYVPARTNPEDPGLEDGIQDDDEGDIFDDDDLNEEEENNDDATLVLDNNRMEKFKNFYKSPAPIVGGLEERCSQAILHAANGLSCLKYFPEQSTSTKTSEKEEEVKMAKPSEPIPMPYSKLDSNIPPTAGPSKKSKKKENRKKKAANKNQDKNSNALLPKNPNEAQPLPAWGGVKVQDDISWKDHLKTLLYEKVVLVYAILAEHHFVNRNYGTSLRCIGLLARCQLVMNRLQYTSGALRENCLLGRAGDCFIMMVQMWEECEKFRQQLQNVTEEDCKLMEQLEQDERLYKINIGNSAMKCVFIYEIRTIEQMLLSSIECYEKALKLSESDSILRRLGNSLNEVGSYYLNLAKKDKIGKDIILTCKKGEPYLVRGLDIFEKIKDDANIALLHTNMGHLHRCIAYAHTPEQRTQLTQKEKFYYNKSVTSYKKALQVLGERNPNPSIWDAIRWELSTALFNMGTISHEYPPPHLSKAEAEKEVIDMLQRALQYCDMEESNPKYPLYLYRAAIIYYRIGSIHHSHIWNATGDFISRKNIIQLANTNYEKSAKMYFQCFDGVNYLTAQMQRLALSEFLSEVAGPMPIVKIKYLQQCLDIVFEMDDMLQLLVEDKIELQEEKEDTGLPDADKTYKTCHSLLGLIAQRLQNVLKMLVKLNISTPPPHKDSKKMAELYKTCYKFSFELRENMEFKEILETLSRVVKNIKKEFGK